MDAMQIKGGGSKSTGKVMATQVSKIHNSSMLRAMRIKGSGSVGKTKGSKGTGKVMATRSSQAGSVGKVHDGAGKGSVSIVKIGGMGDPKMSGSVKGGGKSVKGSGKKVKGSKSNNNNHLIIVPTNAPKMMMNSSPKISGPPVISVRSEIASDVPRRMLR